MYSSIAFIFTLSLMLLPTGVIVGMPVKMFLFILMVSVTLFFLLRSIIIIPKSIINFSIAAYIIFFIMALMGVINGNQYALAELKYLTVASTTTAVLAIYAHNAFHSFTKAILYGTVVYGTIKLVAMFAVTSFISIQELHYLYEGIFSVKFVHMPITGNMHRIQLPPDIIYTITPTLYLLMTSMVDKKPSNKVFLILLLSSAIITFSAYSRVLFFIFVVSSLMAIHFHMNARKLLYPSIVVVSAILLFFSFDSIITSDFLQERLSENNNSYSDSIRSTQISHLVNMWLSKPIFGHGLGAYIENFIRDKEIPFSYEAQLLALIMKGGLLFILAFAASISYFSLQIFRHSGIRLFILFILIIASGFTNPYLTSTATAVLYASFYILSSTAFRKQNLSRITPTYNSTQFKKNYTEHSVI